MTKSLALFVTLVAVLMTAVAAWDRGGNELDRALLVAISIVIIIAVHLLPAITRRPVALLVWFGCLLCAIYGHLTFLTHANLRAGDIRAQQSTQVASTERQIRAIETALSQIQARPVALVAAELAKTDRLRDRGALRAEIAEGERAEALRDDLVRLYGIAATVESAEAKDPVIAHIATATGLNEGEIVTGIGLLFSLLIELVGVLLWNEALRRRYSGNTVNDDTEDEMTELQTAIANGNCRVTVADIRTFLGCSQQRAMEIRRTL